MSSSLQELLLTSSPDGRIAVYDASSGFTLAQFEGSRSPRKGLVLIGKKLNIAASHVSLETGKGFVHIYNWWTATPFYQLPMPEPVAPLVATRDGLYLFAGGVSGEIHSISVPSGDAVRSVSAHSKPITCLEMNADGSLLFSGSDDGTILVFPTFQLLDSSSFKNGPSHSTALQRFIGHESSITAITTSNSTLISCSLDCTCKFWSLMQKTPLKSITFPCSIWDVKMDPLESEIYAAGSDGFVYKAIINVSSRIQEQRGLEIMKWRKKQGGGNIDLITSMATLNWGQTLVTASEDGNISFWDVRKGELIKVLDDQQQQTGSISHLVVATGLSDRNFRSPLARINVNVGGFHRWDLEFLGKNKEPFVPLEQKMDMEERSAAAVTDRKRSIDTLELAIGGYEKLLRFILKEVKTRSSNSKVEDADPTQ